MILRLTNPAVMEDFDMSGYNLNIFCIMSGTIWFTRALICVPPLDVAIPLTNDTDSNLPEGERPIPTSHLELILWNLIGGNGNGMDFDDEEGGSLYRFRR
mmetsp:Transcript_7392/g.10578  ORF Transcript_7392/g.10578 Transcript_7392/m.10578 type:complete len:100 (-) Transcript_7392:1608-1907(-)